MSDPYQATAASFLRFKTEVASQEAALLGCAMFSPRAVPALRAVQAREFTEPFHRNVRQAILDLHDQGLPHDAAAVTDELRRRPMFEPGFTDPGEAPLPVNYQLPARFDPAVPLRSDTAALAVSQHAPLDLDVPLNRVDPTQYGLGAWETFAEPPEVAPGYAISIRESYQARYVTDVCIRGAEHHNRALVEKELSDCPPALGWDLQPATEATGEWVDTRVSTAPSVRQATARRGTPDLLPPHPTLHPSLSPSPAARSLRGG